MRIFVIGTGRCGTVTFSKACEHITNYTSGHETTTHGKEGNGFNFPDNHIEIDPRLSQFMPILIDKYPDALFIHLRRNKKDCVNSLSKRQSLALYNQFHLGSGITDYNKTASIYYDNTVSLVNHLLGRTKHRMIIELESVELGFKRFWQQIKAKGNLGKSLKELKIRYNAS